MYFGRLVNGSCPNNKFRWVGEGCEGGERSFQLGECVFCNPQVEINCDGATSLHIKVRLKQ